MGLHQAPLEGTKEEIEASHFHIHFYPPLLRSATVRKFLVGYRAMTKPDATREMLTDLKIRIDGRAAKRHYSRAGGRKAARLWRRAVQKEPVNVYIMWFFICRIDCESTLDSGARPALELLYKRTELYIQLAGRHCSLQVVTPLHQHPRKACRGHDDRAGKALVPPCRLEDKPFCVKVKASDLQVHY